MAKIPDHIAAIERPVEQLLNYYIRRALASFLAFPVVVVIFYFRYCKRRGPFEQRSLCSNSAQHLPRRLFPARFSVAGSHETAVNP